MEQQQEEVDLIAVGRALWRFRAVVAISVTVGVIVAVVLAFTATPIYRAEVIVTEVHDTGMGKGGGLASQLGGLAALAGMNIGGAADSSHEFEAVLASRYLIEEFLRRHQLAAVMGQGGQNPPTLWKSVRRFQHDVLTIRTDARAGITTVTIDWTDPAQAAKWANDFVALANELIRSRALAESSRNVAYLKDQIAKTNVVELQHVMYDLIENETKALMLANARPEYAFRVIDPAVTPEMRTSPRRAVMVLLGAIMGMVIGICAALFCNWYRTRRALEAKT